MTLLKKLKIYSKKENEKFSMACAREHNTFLLRLYAMGKGGEQNFWHKTRVRLVKSNCGTAELALKV